MKKLKKQKKELKITPAHRKLPMYCIQAYYGRERIDAGMPDEQFFVNLLIIGYLKIYIVVIILCRS